MVLQRLRGQESSEAQNELLMLFVLKGGVKSRHSERGDGILFKQVDVVHIFHTGTGEMEDNRGLIHPYDVRQQPKGVCTKIVSVGKTYGGNFAHFVMSLSGLLHKRG